MQECYSVLSLDEYQAVRVAADYNHLCKMVSNFLQISVGEASRRVWQIAIHPELTLEEGDRACKIEHLIIYGS